MLYSGPKLFEAHPEPMWVYDSRTLEILDVNDSAISKYGYSRDEFLKMTIVDIRPSEDVPALREAVGAAGKGLNNTGIWRHRRKNGDVIHVLITSFGVDYEGRKARLVSARDVSRLVELEQEKSALLEEEQALRRRADAAAYHFRSLFEAAPGNFLVLTAAGYEIVAASNGYLEATMTRREELEGRHVFDVFPDDPDDPRPEAVSRLHASFGRVKETGKTDVMAIQRYPIPLPPERGGGFEERFWSQVNSPLAGPDGAIDYIIHRAEDVTELVRSSGSPGKEPRPSPEIGDHAVQDALGLMLRTEEQRAAVAKLQEQDANLRTAQRLLGMGLWKLDLSTQCLQWSDNVYEQYGVDKSAGLITLDRYVSLVHPGDRDAMLANFEAFLAAPNEFFRFQHRIVRPDGGIVHVRGAGELVDSPDGRYLNGVVLDVTEEVKAAERLARASRINRFAGSVAKLGGWRVDLSEGRAEWSAETALIHEAPDARVIEVDDAIGFYAPEYRGRIRQAFAACARDGVGFDEILQILTAKGNRVWVRSIGEAERNADGVIVAVHGAFQDISELVAARDESEALSRRLREALENMSDAFFLLDAQWRFAFVNGVAERLLDRDRSTLLGQSVWEQFPGALGSAFQAEYEKAVSTGQAVRFSEFYPPLGRWFEVDAYPTAEGLAVYFRDVTDERARQEQLLLLEAAVARQNDLLIITDCDPIDAPDGPRITYVNDAFVRRTGYSREEAVGRTPRILQGAGTDRRELDRIRLALEGRRSVRSELLNYTKDGEAFFLELVISPILDASGRCTHFVAIERDVTDRKRQEETLRESEERFRLIVKATSDVVWDWDIVSDEFWWSENMLSVLGHDPSTLEPGLEAWAGLLHPEERERLVASVWAALEGDREIWFAEYRFRRGDGTYAHVVDRGYIIRDATDKAIRMLGSLSDVSERRELDERLRQSQKLEAVGQLTGGVAHDFNNLLTIILGNAEQLTEQLTDQQQLRLMAEMTATAAERGAELTKRLLAFARRQALQPKIVDANRVIAGMDGLLRRTLSEDIDLEIARAGGLWRTEIDASQLEVAILNLVINARDAMPRGGRVTIETANVRLDDLYARQHDEVTEGQYVMVSVSDTGTGMSVETVAKAFEPFFTTKEVGKGSGLGLSMVFGFTKQSGGHTKIYSELGEGTTVKLYFPRSFANEAEQAEASELAQIIGGREHVLVVEDDELVKTHVSRLLTGLGYRVSSAGTGSEALKMLKQLSDVELLFTDVVMPGGMTGRQLADEALALRPTLKVLFTSGYTENAIVHHGRLDHGVQLLTKPYRRHELAAKIRKVLDG